MQDMLCYLIARDAMHQQQWLAVIEEIGAEATLPMPDSFDRCKEATEFSYMFMGAERGGIPCQRGR